jgi:hypothetical protein
LLPKKLTVVVCSSDDKTQLLSYENGCTLDSSFSMSVFLYWRLDSAQHLNTHICVCSFKYIIYIYVLIYVCKCEMNICAR